jgi:GT2 family glycosyltransferase/glycosyltransferase involved in cell wall biosynthesis
LYRLLRAIFQKMPISARRKRRLKEYAYSRHGRWFERTLGYRLWARAGHRTRDVTRRPPLKAPAKARWAELAAQRSASTPSRPREGDPLVVVPVYGQRDQTLACLEAVLASDPSVDLVVIDDGTHDPVLVADLDDIAQQELIEWVRLPENRGFVEAANRGFMLHPERDVVLLNSDTQVFGDWLDRLSRVAYADPNIGTVTPLSNNGEICSYPAWLVENEAPCEVDDETLDALAAEANGGRFVDAPTAVGFCMYVKRACLSATGLFDAAFGRGYGEENDFCLRASAQGWRHVIAGEVFVRHQGASSFGEASGRLREAGEALVRARHPAYDAIWASYRREDPVSSLREGLDVARLRHAAPHAVPLRTLLLVTHEWGGGVAVHVNDLRGRLEAEGVNVFVLQPAEGVGSPAVVLRHPGVDARQTSLRFDTALSHGDLARVARALGVDHLHVHHLGDLGVDSPTWVARLADALACGYDLTVHDYLPICPRLHLIDGSGVYCGEPEVAACEACVRGHGSAFGRPSVQAWRDTWSAFLGGARAVFCPSSDVVHRLGRYFPDVVFTLRPHPWRQRPARSITSQGPARDGRRRVVVLGSIGPSKGAEVLLACARDAACRDLPLVFHVVGDTDRDEELEATGCVEITGGYEPEDVGALLGPFRGAIGWLPSVWPETWSYTLTELAEGGLFPVAFDLGAPAERIRGWGCGALLPVALWHDAAAVNDRLLSLQLPARLPRFEVFGGEGHYVTLRDDYYHGFARE